MGWLFLKKPPKEINSLFGYRTDRSMRSMEAWDFAHRYTGKIWLVGGIVMVPPSIVFLLLVTGKGAGTVGTVGGIVTVAQICFLAGAIVPTERALKRCFGDDSRPKRPQPPQ